MNTELKTKRFVKEGHVYLWDKQVCSVTKKTTYSIRCIDEKFPEWPVYAWIFLPNNANQFSIQLIRQGSNPTIIIKDDLDEAVDFIHNNLVYFG